MASAFLYAMCVYVMITIIFLTSSIWYEGRRIDDKITFISHYIFSSIILNNMPSNRIKMEEVLVMLLLSVEHVKHFKWKSLIATQLCVLTIQSKDTWKNLYLYITSTKKEEKSIFLPGISFSSIYQTKINLGPESLN